MSAVAHIQIIPIHEYAAIKAELEFWKNEYFSLQTQLNVKTISNPSAIYIKENGVARNVLLNNIIMIEAESNYSIIHLVDGQRILTSKTLKIWSDLISKRQSDFQRVHRSYYVNTKHIIAYKALERCMIMTNNISVKVSKGYRINFYR
jgi:DNA-binding LytR/AlgR family response regulator